MYVNNETGVIQDIETISNMCREKSISFHIDVAQAVSKVDFSLANLNVDLMSFSGYEVWALKELAHSSICFTIGRFNTEEEIDYTVKFLIDKIAKLRDLSPLWEMFKDGIDVSSYEWQEHGEPDTMLHN